MEKGNLRADVNVSVRRPGEALGTRCEIKNVNSIRFAAQAIEHEARRQMAILEDGGAIDQETRLFDPGRGETRSMRSKEEAHDYRYFPDPDLLPLEFDDAYVAALRSGPAGAARCRSVRGSWRRIRALAPTTRTCSWRNGRRRISSKAVARGRDGKQAANWVINELLGALNKTGLGIEASPVSAEQLGALLDLQKEAVISGKIAKDVFEIMLAEGGDPRQIVEARGLKQVTDTGAIEEIVDEVDRRQSGQGGAGEGKARDARLVRRAGDEGEPGQGQPAGGQRAFEGEARHRVKPGACRAPYPRSILTQHTREAWECASFFVLLLVFGLAGPAAAVSDADRAAIQSTIDRQLQAFLADDGATAYSFAAPNITAIFPSVESFMAMVRQRLSAGLPAALLFVRRAERRSRPDRAVCRYRRQRRGVLDGALHASAAAGRELEDRRLLAGEKAGRSRLSAGAPATGAPPTNRCESARPTLRAARHLPNSSA